VKSIKDTCYIEEYLPEDACAAFRKTLDKRCQFIQIEVGALSSFVSDYSCMLNFS
jgi:hypothetical protein